MTPESAAEHNAMPARIEAADAVFETALLTSDNHRKHQASMMSGRCYCPLCRAVDAYRKAMGA